ncbi:MAG: M6 family metalloprotease domain-containing protein [Ignavibacteriales bacterium]|nr:M6 family metalloprotease domain-containing protein [Ignavibacteriales bacterium]
MFRFQILRVSALLFILILAVSTLWSAPLSFVPIELVQPDGTRLHVFASGDEFYNWVHDKDSYTIIQDPTSHYYVYAILGKGKLLPSSSIVGRIDPKVTGLTPAVNVFPVYSQRQTFAKATYASMVSKTGQTSEFSNLVIFIRFQLEPEFSDTSANLYDSQFNSPSGPSLKEYYQEVSYSQLAVSSYIIQRSGNAIVSYQDSHQRGYYLKYDAVTNPLGYTTDADAREANLLRNAITAVTKDLPTSLNLDGNGDGNVDNVTFVVSGTAAGWADLLWPHMSTMSSSPAISINGKIVSSYNFQLDKMLDVGVLCHEMGHSVGMPDLYRYTNTAISPCGTWDIMCGGSAHMTNYLKYKYGKWISSIPEISADGTYWLKVSTSPTNNVYKIKSPRSVREYFVLEFRKENGLYESLLPGSGLIVYRINERVSGNASGPPDEIYVYRPNGTLWINGNPSQAYLSSESGRTTLGDSTNPASFLSDGFPGGLSIKNIGSSSGDSIRFDVHIVPSVPITNDYSASMTNYSWIDISNSGNAIQNWMNGTASRDSSFDDGYTANAIPLGFKFTYYGNKYDSIYVGINGLVSFTQKALNINSSGFSSLNSFGYFSDGIYWPGNTQFPASIAVAYNDYDLNPKDTYGGGRILYQTLGNRFILSWINVGTFEQKGDTSNSFQLVLDASNSSITVNFQNFGLTATRQAIKIGIQKDSTNGLSWLEAGDYTERIPSNGSSVIIAPSVSTGIAEPTGVPTPFALEQNYPNPFNPTTHMKFEMKATGLVSLKIYDMLGREVETLESGEKLPGTYEMVWDASRFASGIYFYRLSTGKFSQVRKMILMK